MTKRSTTVDILRATAVLLVLGRHINLLSTGDFSAWHSFGGWFSETWTRGGWIGVDLFFVLSGFLVSGLLFREHQKFGTISAKDFLIRRGFKIYPAFWVLTLLYIGSGLILIASLTFKLPENKILKSAAYVGSHSYSIYLWHVPVAICGLHLLARCLGPHATGLINCTFYFFGSIFLGIFMAVLVEFPLLRIRDRWFPSRARPLSVSAQRPAMLASKQSVPVAGQTITAQQVP